MGDELQAVVGRDVVDLDRVRGGWTSAPSAKGRSRGAS